jgi:GMP synthase (glutamine-hydrolysing)
VNFGRHPDAEPSLDGYDALVVLGGPMSVWETDRHPHLETELRLVDGALERGIPVLGICLGAQLIARALGARVERNPTIEIGWYDLAVTEAGRADALLGHFGERQRVFEWHRDAFDLPRGAVHLAATAECENQAFRYAAGVYGFQFHLEIDAGLVERWLRVPDHLEDLARIRGDAGAEEIRRETPLALPAVRALADRAFGSFIDLLGPRRRVRHLPSR